MPKKVLIIEDNKVHMDALCKILENLHKDIIVYCASDAERALQMAIEQHIHLFLVDIVLNTKNSGDVSGLNLVRELREVSKYKFTPVIFITSLEDPKLYSYSQLHCFGYIEKPFGVAQVRDTVLGALEFPVKEDDDRYVYFKKDGIVYSVYLKDIICIQSIRKKMKIYCVKDELEISYKTCEEILLELNSESFIQCSRCCVVNKKFIENIDYSNRFIKLRHMNDPVEIGAIMRKTFRQKMENE